MGLFWGSRCYHFQEEQLPNLQVNCVHCIDLIHEVSDLSYMALPYFTVQYLNPRPLNLKDQLSPSGIDIGDASHE